MADGKQADMFKYFNFPDAPAAFESREDEVETLFAKLVAAGQQMRDAQAIYFKTRTQSALRAAKAAEDNFDRVLKECVEAIGNTP